MRTVEHPMKVLAVVKRTIEAERKKAERAKLSFVAADDATLVAKLMRANSPFIISVAYNPGGPSGATWSFKITVFNPDPVTRNSLYAWAFFGPANMVADPVSALLTTDPRFPRQQQPVGPGLSLAPNASGSIAFQLKIPTIEPGGYAAHAFLYQFSSFDVGPFIDRASAHFEVP